MTVSAIATDGRAAAAEAPARPKKMFKIVIVGLLVAMVATSVWWFMLKPPPGGAHPAPQPGTVVPIDPIQVNLAGGHYLKIGVALQLTKGTAEADGSKALDALIATFSGRRLDELVTTEQREKLRKKLESSLEKSYEHEVMGVYYTDFVTQ